MWSTGYWIMLGRENGWKMVPCYNEGFRNRLFAWKWGNIFPSLVGGFVAMVDGRIYDASVRTQLEALREELTAQEERT